MSTESEKAFEAAEAEIARVKAAGEAVLNLSPRGPLNELALTLETLPPSIGDLDRVTILDLSRTLVSDLRPIAGMVGISSLLLSGTQVSDLGPIKGILGMKSLFLSGTPVSDLGPIKGMVGMTILYLSRTPVSDLRPIAGLVGMTRLDLSRTLVSDLGPIAGMVEMRHLDLTYTRVSNLGPIAGITHLGENQIGFEIIAFEGTPATANDPHLAEISTIKDSRERAEALLAYLAQKAAPPAIPEYRPAPLAVEMEGETLVRAHPGPPLPDGPISSRAETGWREIRHARDDFAGSVNLDNYRAVKSAIGALDRGMGQGFADLNQIAVGMIGERLARLAADAELTERMPEGAGAELSALAAQVQTLANRFPEWIAYLQDAEGDNPPLSTEAAQALGELAKELSSPTSPPMSAPNSATRWNWRAKIPILQPRCAAFWPVRVRSCGCWPRQRLAA